MVNLKYHSIQFQLGLSEWSPPLSKQKSIQPKSSCGQMQKIPIFIITCDRVGCLQATIDSYKKCIASPFEIVIHDNNSTYKPLLDYLKQLEQEGITVYHSTKSVTVEEQLNSVAQSIDDWFTSHSASYYVVTDPDIALEGNCEDILELFAYLLDTVKDIEVVGPMLRIDDIPDFYPLKQRAISRHTEQFWHKKPLTLRCRNKTIQYQSALIDTTFGMYRRGFRFHRLCKGYRIYAPYGARHLDWYINPAQMEEDQIYYLQHASGVSHWSGTWLRESIRKDNKHASSEKLIDRHKTTKEDAILEDNKGWINRCRAKLKRAISLDKEQ